MDSIDIIRTKLNDEVLEIRNLNKEIINKYSSCNSKRLSKAIFENGCLRFESDTVFLAYQKIIENFKTSDNVFNYSFPAEYTDLTDLIDKYLRLDYSLEINIKSISNFKSLLSEINSSFEENLTKYILKRFEEMGLTIDYDKSLFFKKTNEFVSVNNFVIDFMSPYIDQVKNLIDIFLNGYVKIDDQVFMLDISCKHPLLQLSNSYLTATCKEKGNQSVLGNTAMRDGVYKWEVYVDNLVYNHWIAFGVCNKAKITKDYTTDYNLSFMISSKKQFYKTKGELNYIDQGKLYVCELNFIEDIFKITGPNVSVTNSESFKGQEMHLILNLSAVGNQITVKNFAKIK